MVRFSWNKGNEEHIAAHGVTPAEAEEAYRDRRALNVHAHSGRFALIGRTIKIVYERHRNGTIRVVTAYSARPADRYLYQHQA